VNPDTTRSALASLDPEERALLELSGVRGLADHEIASMLGLEAGRMRERRRAALGELAAALGTSQRSAEAALAELGSGSRAGDPVDPDGDEEEHSPGTPPPGAPGDSGKRGLAAGLGGLAIAAGVAVALAVGGEDAPRSGGSATGTGSEERARGSRVGEAVRLRAVTRDRGSGTAALVDSASGSRRLRLSVRGLPAPGTARYSAWLYSSVTDARRLASFPRGTFTVDLPLPRDYERYRFVDISIEAGDANRNHSGESVLRVPTASLLAPR
jgi:hypothetical protein